MAKISIITALYNHEKYFREAIESVLSQTFKDWEYIIWDDGSTDSSLSIAKEYALKNPDKIKVFTHSGGKNLGQEVTRNAAFEKSSGELICILDSDDIFHPQKLELLVPCFDHEKVGLAYGVTDVRIEPSGWIVSDRVGYKPSGNVFNALLENNFVSASGVLVRRKCLENGLRFDSRFKTCGEYPLWLNIARDWEFRHIPKVVSWWRSHDSNLGSKMALKAKAELVQLGEHLDSDDRFQKYSNDIKKVLVRRRYDYANELYFHQAFKESKAQLKRVLDSDPKGALRVKATSLYALTHLGSIPNRYLSQVKKKIWEIRRPF